MFKRHLVPSVLLAIAPTVVPFAFSQDARDVAQDAIEVCDAGVTTAPTEMVFEADAGTSVEQATEELVDAGVVTQEEIDAGRSTVTLGTQDSADAGATDSADAGVSPSVSQATIESPLFFESPKMPSRIAFQSRGIGGSRSDSILLIENTSDRDSIWDTKFGVPYAEFVTPAEQSAALLVLQMMQEDPYSNPFARKSNGKLSRLKLPARVRKLLANSQLKPRVSSILGLSDLELISAPMISESGTVTGVTFCELGGLTCVSVPLSDDQVSVLREVVVDPDAVYGAIRVSSDLEDLVLRKKYQKFRGRGDSTLGFIKNYKNYAPAFIFSELVKSADGKSAILSGMAHNLITVKVTKKPVAAKKTAVDPKHIDNQSKICR